MENHHVKTCPLLTYEGGAGRRGRVTSTRKPAFHLKIILFLISYKTFIRISKGTVIIQQRGTNADGNYDLCVFRVHCQLGNSPYFTPNKL